jgi:hypothetical protein
LGARVAAAEWHFKAQLVDACARGGSIKRLLYGARADLFEVDPRQGRDLSGVLDRHAHEIALLIEIDGDVLGDVSRLIDGPSSKLEKRGIGVFEVLDVHGLNLRSKNAL